jgi:hypothetical protein
MSDVVVVMSTDEALKHAADLCVPVTFSTPDGITAQAWPDGVVHIGERLSSLPVKRGTLDWHADFPKRIMMDPPETNDPSLLCRCLAACAWMAGSAFFILCAALGALLLSSAIRNTLAVGWSWEGLARAIGERLGPA